MNNLRKYFLGFGLGVLGLGLLSGCMVRTYTVVKDRVDQEVAGNQGFLNGAAPADYQKEKLFTKRDTKVVEVELRSPLKFGKSAPKPAATEVSAGDVTTRTLEGENLSEVVESSGKSETYVVQKNDTLQKISARKEIYGTTKKWTKIYNANKDKLSAPDKIYPGQELRIPRD